MRVNEFLIEYNMTSLVNIFGDKLMAKWRAEGEPFKDRITDNEEVTAEDLMRWMEQYDPTQNNKYITWVVNKYAGKKGGIARLEDIPTQLAGVLDTYEKLSRKNLLKSEHKNINQIKTLTDLHDIVDEYKEEDIESQQETSKAEEQAFYDNNEAELIFNNNEYKIVIPKTEKASCYFGKNTRWCTTGDNDNMFSNYHKWGPLYIILHKATNEKWQWHFELAAYMDARDVKIDMDNFFKKHKIAANAVIKHYGGSEIAATVDPINWFKYTENPSEELQLTAVNQDGHALKYIKNPSEAVQLAAVTQNGHSIKYIDNPSEEMQLVAVNQHGPAIHNIKNPSETVQLAAVKQNVYALKFIENPSEEIQLAAVNQRIYAIDYIENPTEAVKLAAQAKNNESVNFDLNRLQTLSGITQMRVQAFLLEYNITSLINLFGDKLMAKWQAEGEPFKDSISDNEVITAEDIMRWMEQYDPTQNNKYITWMVNKYAGKKGGIARLEDIPTQLADVLDTYEKLNRKNLLKPEHKNINQIKTLNDLHDIVDEYKEEDTASQQETTKAEEQEFYDNNEAELIFDSNEYKVVIPKTQKASCYFGKNTRWCTTGDNDNMFATYHEDGPLYVILHKATNEKWQWHFESRQYMDARDVRIDMDEFLKKHKVAATAVIKHVGSIEKATAVDPTSWFKYIENPSEEMQRTVVEQPGLVIKDIKNPSEAVQLAAVKQNGHAIDYIKNPSEEMQLAAVTEYGPAIKYIVKKGINPSEAVQLGAVNQNGSSIQYIKNPSEEIQLAAVKRHGHAIKYIKNPSEELQLAAVNKNIYAIEDIESPSEAVQLTTVKRHGPAIQYIENPSEEMQLVAVKQDGRAIKYIDNPSEEVQLAAVKQNIYAIQWIQNPSEAVQRMERPSEAVKRASLENNYESVDSDLNRLQTLSGIK